jgi:glucokinase
VRAIGIDVGGTKVAVAAVDANGRVVARAEFPTDPARGFPRARDLMAEACDNVLSLAGWAAADLAGIGVGCTGPVDPARGTVHNPHTLPTWDGCDLVTPLRERLGVPVTLDNDAAAAAVGEAAFGAGRGADPVVVLTFGTGVGGATVVGGRVLRGAGGAHPEPGHLPVLVDGPACYCGGRGCLESVASGTAIGEAGRRAGLADARAVFAAAARGDAAAGQIVARAAEGLAAAAWLIAHAVLPERLVLGGGVMDEHFDVFAAAARDRLAAATMVPGERVRVVRAALGADAGVVGAARLGATAAG